MSRFIVLLAIASSVLATIFACSGNKIISVDPKFRKWVSGYTSGIISNSDHIEIELRDQLDSSKLAELGMKSRMDEKILKEIIEISPAVDADFEWTDFRTIRILPKKPLSSNQIYTVSLDLDEIMSVEKGYEEFNFQFATKPQKIHVSEPSLIEYDSYNLEWYSLRGEISMTDHFDTTKLKDLIKVQFDGSSPKVRFEESYGANEYIFIVDSIKRSAKEQTVSVEWNGDPIASFSNGSTSVKVPALGDFELSSYSVNEDDDQSIRLSFSEPLSSNQDLNGLIDLEGVTGETFSIYYNEVTVFIPNRIEGTYRLKVNSGIKNIKNYSMLKGCERSLIFTPSKPKVRITGSGSILPDSKGLIFPFETIGLKSATIRIIKIYEENVHHFLQVNDLNDSEAIFRFGKKIAEKNISLGVKKEDKSDWVSHVLDLEKWIRPEPGAIYRISIKFEQKDTYCDCPASDENSDETNENTASNDNGWSERPWHLDDWDDGYEDWGGYNSESPCSSDYYYGKAVSRNILASNIGVIYKLDAKKEAHVFLTDMITTQPIPNASVTFYDFAKQVIASGTTNSEGMYTKTLSEKPFLLIAKYGKQRGYLKVGDGHSNLLSEFDVEGEEVQNGLKGYVYAERGVWRPGDSIYVNFVLRDYENKLPANHPVTFTLTDPSGYETAKITRSTGLNGHYDFRTATGYDAKTGIYTARVVVGSREFVKYLKVETVKPNRLKIKLNVPKGASPDSLLSLESVWLHGAPAKNLRATVDVEYQSTRTIIPGYPRFEFDSPIRKMNSDKNTLFDDDLDASGKAQFKQKTASLSHASGMLNAIYTMRVFEQGGNFSIDRFSQLYSPYKQYVGFRTPDTEADNSLISGKKHSFDVVMVNASGELLKKPSKIRVKIYRMEWRWWYESGDDDLGNFIARNGNMLVYDSLLNCSNGKTAFHFGLKEADYGRFLITVTDEEGFHQAGKIVSIDVPYWSRGNQKNNEYASMLNFSTDKKSYVKGETVKLSIPSPASGKALISIETRTKIVKKFWVNTIKGETTCSFETTEDMAPNAYVHVSLIQPHSATTNDLPIRMYGIVPILVDDPATHLHPEIDVAKEWRPESTAKVTVKEKSGKGMTYTLAIVDEGLLDLTRFSTPNPWNTFYAKEALGIKTWDMYNAVIGAYSGKLNRLLSIGGDGSADDGAGPKANRFKPMVHFLGPFVLPAGSSKTHQVELPTYIGSVRVMVVAHSATAFGNAEETVTIKKPLMVLGTLPRVIGPTETIHLPVDVFAMKENIKNVDVQVSCNELLAINGAKNQGLKFTGEGDQIVNFELKVANKIGIAKIKIHAKSGSETATQEFEVDVRSPNPQVLESETKEIAPGTSVSFAMEQDGISGSHSYSLETSQFSSINLSGRMSELINYPHGCIEQSTSAVFPQLFAMDIMQFSEKEKAVMVSNIKAALLKYQSFQQYEGGFAYWPGNREASDWGSNYAGHFMIEAEQHGFILPNNLKARWIDYQKNQANNWSASSYSNYSSHAEESNQLIQAYRLYTLALAGKPELGAMNRLKEQSNLGVTAKWRLAAAYYLVGQKDLAKQMTRNLSFAPASYREYAYSYGSTLRDKAMNLEAAQLIESKSMDQLEKEIADVLKSNQWLSTQEAGYCILSLTSGKIKNNGALQFEINSEKVTASKCLMTKNYSDADGAKLKRLTVKNTSSKKLFVTFCTKKVPQIGKEKKVRSNLVMDIAYTNLNGVEIDPSKIMQGTDFIMKVTLKNPTKDQFYREMTLNQIMPSGWEIHNARLYDEENTSNIDYQDYRDDRVYSYFKLAPNETKIFKIQLNASYLGRFYLPAVFSEAMYDHTVNAQEKGRWVEVTKIIKQPKSS